MAPTPKFTVQEETFIIRKYHEQQALGIELSDILKARSFVDLTYLYLARDKSLLALWVTTFLPDWQPALIFVQFISNFLCMCSNGMASAHVILK